MGRSRTAPLPAALGALAALATACGGANLPLPPPDRVLTLVDERISSRMAVDVPRAAVAGVAFDVTVHTLSSACTAPAGGDLRVSGSVAELTPYEAVVDDECPAAPVLRARVFSMRFDRAGAAVVRVRARSAETGEAVVIERPVAVAP
jgi:hypothetical protein